jgi:hypothetical protein
MSHAIASSLTQAIRRYRSEAGRSSDAIAACRMLAFIYVFSIWVVATTLFVAVNEIEPDRRLALAFKFLIVFASAAAIAGRLTP